MIDYGPSPSIRARWEKGAGIRAMKRHASKAYHAARKTATALGFIETSPRGIPAKRDTFPPLDPARLAVAFRQGLAGGSTVETVPAAEREKKFVSHVTVQTHQTEAIYKSISGRSVSDVLDDYEAQKAIVRNFHMSALDLRMWRRRRGAVTGGPHFHDTVQA